MGDDLKCKWVKAGGDYWEICQKKVPDAPPMTMKGDGSWLGWFMCNNVCTSSYEAPKYDWFKGKCECIGTNLPLKWRR
jgi:hypothetical protein